MPDLSAATETKEQAIARGFAAIISHIRQNGLTDGIAGVEDWIDHVNAPALKGAMARLLGFYWLRKQNAAKAIHYSDMANILLSHDADSTFNALCGLSLMGRWPEVATRGEAALARFGEMERWHNILCSAHGYLGHRETAQAHGAAGLALKDAAASGPVHPLSDVPVPPFDPARPRANAISFSLFGNKDFQSHAAILNARAARFLYPGWCCRFYVDDLATPDLVRALDAEGARVLRVDGLPAGSHGGIWRFLVADDKEVERYLVRDSQALLNIRERAAVEAWLGSDRHFHVMRDNFDHSELLLPGLWGGIRGALPPIGPWVRAWMNGRAAEPGNTLDHKFAGDQLWPTIRTSVLTHDSQFDFGASVDFPPGFRLPSGCHAGCDARLFLGADHRNVG